MSRSRAIETRLEKLIPSLDEYFTSGFLSRAESQEVARQRTHWEYRLVAKPLLILDVRNAVEYELGLEERLRQHCIKTKLQLKHRWTIVERIESIYQIGLKHLRDPAEKESLRREYVLFMKQYSRGVNLSRAYAAWMMQFPSRQDIWVEAMLWEGVEQNKMDDARAMAQQALLTMAGTPDVWACALKLELHFVSRLLDGLVADEKDDMAKREAQTGTASSSSSSSPATAVTTGSSAANATTTKRSGLEIARTLAEKLGEENAAMTSILLDLALAKTVVEEALESPCSGPALVSRLLHVAGDYAFAKPVTMHIATLAMTRVVDTALSPTEDRHGRKLPLAASASSSSSTSGLVPGHVAAQRARTAWLSSTPITTTGSTLLSSSSAFATAAASSSSTASARPLAGGIDLLCRCYLAFPTLQIHFHNSSSSNHASAVADPLTYMACALDGPVGRAQWALSPAQRETAVLDSLMSILYVFIYVPLHAEEGSQVTVEARERAKAVRQLLNHLVPSSNSASASTSSATTAAACVHRTVCDLLEHITPTQREDVSSLCRRLLTLADSHQSSSAAWPSLRALALSLANYCVEGGAAEAQPAGQQSRKGKKGQSRAASASAAARGEVPEVINQLADDAKARVQSVLERVMSAAATAPPATTRTRHEGTEPTEACDLLNAILHWPVSLLGRFLTQSDQDALLSSAVATSGKSAKRGKASAPTAMPFAVAGESLTAETVDRFMTWWRARQPFAKAKAEAAAVASARQHDRNDDEEGLEGRTASSESLTTMGAGALLEVRRQCREAAVALLQPALRSATRPTTTTKAEETPAESHVLAALRARHQPLVAVESPTGRRGTDGAAQAPLNMWRVFAALEALDGADMPLTSSASVAHKRGAHAASSSSDDDGDSDSDDDDDNTQKGSAAKSAALSYPNYAMAGIAFLSTASSGALSRAGEWERAHGIHALLRCRLESLTSRSAPRLRRDELVQFLLESALPSCPGKGCDDAAGARGAWLPAWMQDMLVLVREAQQRCHPLPRLTYSGIIIPIYEAVADLCVRHAHKFLRPCGIDARRAAQHWLAEARSAHEQLLAIYGISRHLESFVPILFNGKQSASGAQSDRVAAFNTEDWIAYIAFERTVASDLSRSAAVAERARREALNPQDVLVQLMRL